MQEEKQQSYQWVENNGRGYLQLPLLNHPSLLHFFGTRLLSEVSLENGRLPIRLHQVHKDRIRHVNHEVGPFSDHRERLEGDGLATQLPNCLITVSTADCLSILLFDPVETAISVIHAGWRGSVLNIAGKGIDEMVLTYGSDRRNVLAGLGPSIGPCCFEVKADVADAVKKNTPYEEKVLQKKGERKWDLDLVGLNTLQLIEAGVPSEQIASTGLCTVCLPNLFFSYRRDKKKIDNMLNGMVLI